MLAISSTSIWTTNHSLKWHGHQEQTLEDVNASVFVAVAGLRLSAAEYDRFFHSRYNGGDRTGKVGHEII